MSEQGAKGEPYQDEKLVAQVARDTKTPRAVVRKLMRLGAALNPNTPEANPDE